MRVVFANAPDDPNPSQLVTVGHPLNIGYLASVAQACGHEVIMWDFCVEPLTEEAIFEKIKKDKPDVVGISSMTPGILWADFIATTVKKYSEDIFTVIGGVHVTTLPEQTLLEFNNFDFGVITEAEGILPEILRSLEVDKKIPTHVPGVAWKELGMVRKNSAPDYIDIDSIPYPHRTLLPKSYYDKWHATRGVSQKQYRIEGITSSRGCPFKCTFCNVGDLHGHKVRYRSPENVVGEIEHCIEQYNTNYIAFNESTFASKRQRAIDIVTHMPEEIVGYQISTHVNMASAELYKTMARTRCHTISFGVESGSDRVLKAIKKNTTAEKIRRAFAYAHEAKIPNIEATFILGSDIYETEEDMLETEKILKDINPDSLGLGIIVPFPGTPQYLQMQEMGFLDGVSWDQYQIFSETPPPWRIVNFSNEELVARRNKMLKSYYLSPGYMFKKLRSIRDIREILYYTRMAAAFFRMVVKKAA